MFEPAIRHSGITKKLLVPLGPITVPSGRRLDQRKEEIALYPKASLQFRATTCFIPLLFRMAKGKKSEDPGRKWLQQSLFHPTPLTLGKG